MNLKTTVWVSGQILSRLTVVTMCNHTLLNGTNRISLCVCDFLICLHERLCFCTCLHFCRRCQICAPTPLIMHLCLHICALCASIRERDHILSSVVILHHVSGLRYMLLFLFGLYFQSVSCQRPFCAAKILTRGPHASKGDGDPDGLRQVQFIRIIHQSSSLIYTALQRFRSLQMMTDNGMLVTVRHLFVLHT